MKCAREGRKERKRKVERHDVTFHFYFLIDLHKREKVKALFSSVELGVKVVCVMMCPYILSIRT